MYIKAIQDADHKKDCVISMLDINNFKHINDTYGHDVGDRCLITFARIFQEQLTTNAKMYRIGGDEFIVIAKKQSLYEIRQNIEHIRSILNEMKLDFAYGACEYQKDDDIQELIKSADEQLYKDKKNRKVILEFSDIALDVIKM